MVFKGVLEHPIHKTRGLFFVFLGKLILLAQKTREKRTNGMH